MDDDGKLTDEDLAPLEAAIKADARNPHAYDWINDLQEAPSLDPGHTVAVFLKKPESKPDTPKS